MLTAHLSPSQEIKDPDRLVGRDKYLTQVRRALLSPGRHVFIYGERGIGKTSLAISAGRLATLEDHKNFIYVPCGEHTTFFEVIDAIGGSVVSLKERVGAPKGGFTFGVSAPVGGVSMAKMPSLPGGLAVPSTMSEAFDILRYVRSKLTGQIIITVDEFDRLQSREDKRFFAELLKNVSSIIDDMRIVICGIGANVDEFLGEHLSTGRMFEPVEVDKLSHDSLWKILSDATGPLGVTIPTGFLLRIGIISDGFPHFVHLIGECLLYAMHDDPSSVNICNRGHFDKALKESLQKAEPSLRRIYQMATEKSKNKLDYEDALWSLADRSATRRQLKDIYDSSYKRIWTSRSREGSPLTREILNQRLLTLRKDSHANILVGHGSGWFSFRENVVRGYVRLKAESDGVELVPDPTN
ncbi:MAG: ATP-binding protein [Amaricoccus sp.]